MSCLFDRLCHVVTGLIGGFHDGVRYQRKLLGEIIVRRIDHGLAVTIIMDDASDGLEVMSLRYVDGLKHPGQILALFERRTSPVRRIAKARP
ncbi:MAG: hypothetical protein GFH27_549297n46 [Chloroflexi bacterium AL-W]|nr:hypothetical protein [Chloroflexi bacterium AL-N1]NOK68570.1 hypothetical protein [Chloroflexi bacterium AL-N10]NOK76056.1 hypothetical protein [Chloroflexi bacterium AL-N5]NOK82529.1 hypothetical protein [Chloroflexi bacterium AL-W]NOK92839.1 hypothetical protein [Chloroflexi bacterium AL-N15]